MIFLPIPEKVPFKSIENFIREGVVAATEYFPIEMVYEYKDFKEGVPYIFGMYKYNNCYSIYTFFSLNTARYFDGFIY